MAYPPIIEEFVELVQIPTHSRQERLIADVLTRKLLSLGLEVTEDRVGEVIGGNAGNLIARWPGDAAIPALLFSAHMDRVANPGKIVPLVKPEDDQIVSEGDTILAADDVSGIVAILDGIRRVTREKAPHGDVEIVFSVAEEVGLLGVRHMDMSRLKSQIAYVLDSGGTLGTLVNRAPTQYTYTIVIEGRASHAGMSPEKGLNAINVAAVAIGRLPEGRVSPLTTGNIGLIEGGEATNIVCDRVTLIGEARSHDSVELDFYLGLIQRVFREACQERGAGLKIDFNLEYAAFHVPTGEPVLTLATEVFAAMGIRSEIVSSGGGQDGNYFNERGIKAVGLATDYDHVHTREETQRITSLVKCGEVVAELIKARAREKA
ncbi:MAG: M20/M25/M40 family metallo-hydrolase [Deltaproteobacteria bacterium]|jgi:tripeptide aminopeptidase|nr:M20/M25/M40 family metallo-hydrolase [Deltaproteobacteria bacterium]